MKFIETKLPGAYIIEPEKREDDRGFFARAFCKNEFGSQNLHTDFVQANIGFSHKKGTLRGLHYQNPPHSETKVVRCTNGALFDVIIDLRKNSPTYKQWIGTELTADNYKMVYIPEGFAHGYLTLKANTAIYYMVSSFYTPGAEGGVRFDDQAFKIEWPVPVEVITDKDKSWKDYKE